jgi:hypothetical protein
MKLNSLIFPAPNPPKYSYNDLKNEIIFIPRIFHQKENEF